MESRRLGLLFALTVSVSTLPLSLSVKCFACTSNLPQEHSDYAKNLAKKVISTYYVLPEVSQYCNNPKDLDFQNILKVDCDREDVCAKITASVEGLTFTIRGCKKSIFKQSGDNTPCNPNGSPSLCECSSELCNGSSAMQMQGFLLLAGVLTVLLVRFSFLSRLVE